MSLKHEFNRLSHLFDGGVENTRKHASHWLDSGSKQAGQFTRRVRDQVDSGRRGAVTLEESFVRHVRDNPAMYIMAAAILIGALIARLMIEARQPPRAPLL